MEMSLQSNAASHWLGAHQESVLVSWIYIIITLFIVAMSHSTEDRLPVDPDQLQSAIEETGIFQRWFRLTQRCDT